MRGLDEGHDPYILNVTELVKQAWGETSDRTIAHWWLIADIIPSYVQDEIQFNHRKVQNGQIWDEDYEAELAGLIVSFAELKLKAESSCDIVETVHDFANRKHRKLDFC